MVKNEGKHLFTDCKCSRDCDIIEYNRFHSEEEYDTVIGTCPDTTKFPWVLLRMNCKNIEEPT